MNSDAGPTSYARTQLKEARRRLDSVQERITEDERHAITGAVNKDTGEIVMGEEINDIPEKQREFVVLREKNRKTTNIKSHIQNVIIDCQMSIELSVKSMYKAADVGFDHSHGINFSSHNTQDFNREIPADFPRRDDVVRAIFLTQLWEKFYEYAKYGAPELNVGPSVIFNIMDGERALNDASFCVALAEDFIDFLEEEG